MNLKRLADLLPMMAVVLIFNGYLKLHIFYGHWGLRISDYVDTSEILLSFLADINILAFFFVTLLFQAMISGSLVRIADKAVFDNSNETGKLSVDSVIDYLQKKNKWRTLLIYLGLNVAAWSLFYVFNKLPLLYILFICLFGLLTFIFEVLLPKNPKLQLQLTFLLSIISLTTEVAFYDIKEVKTASQNYYCRITTDHEIIQTSASFYLIGQTKKYIYLFDEKESRTEIVRSEETRKIEIYNIKIKPL